MINYLNFFKEEPLLSLLIPAGIIITNYFNNLYWLFILFIILFILMIWFYREPIINLPYYNFQSDEVYSPAFGTIEKIEHINGIYKIAIELTLFDIHIQYFPVSGRVIDQIRTPMSVTTIVKNIMWGINDKDRIVKITQRIGYIARRIATPETRNIVSAGHRLGMIKLGSHVDLEISDKYNLLIKIGDYVNGPYSKIAEWNYK
jgi:phosphatidylserine decarboxylase precursor-related protein